MVSELILKYMTQGGRGLYRFANFSKKQFCTSKTCKKQLSTNVLRPSTTHYYFARLTSGKKRKPELEQWRNLAAPHSLTLWAKTAVPVHAHAALQSPDNTTASSINCHV